MATKDESKQAFPVPVPSEPGCAGMTLREWYIGHAPEMPVAWFNAWCAVMVGDLAIMGPAVVAGAHAEARAEWAVTWADRVLGLTAGK